MPKHNIDAIAAAAVAAHAAYDHYNAAVPPAAGATFHATPELLAEVRVKVLETIHGTPKDDAGGTIEERRADRLFSAIVKALTVRI